MKYLVADGGCQGKANARQIYGSHMILDGASLESASVLKHTTFNDPTAERQTNNVAEYTALIEGLKSLIERTNSPKITVIMDSKLVLNQVGGSWKVTKPHLLPLRDEAVRLLAEFEEVVLKWVPRSVIESYLGH